MNRRKEIRARLAAREIVTGCSADQPSVALAEFLGRHGFDLVFLDTEHAGPGVERIVDMAIGARAGNAASVLRPWSRDPGLLRRFLDCGIDGLIIPDVESAEDVRSVVKVINDAGPPGYQDLILIGLIESISAIRNLAGILAEPRLDAVLVGPADLAVSLGLPRWTNDEVIRGHAFGVLKTAREASRSAGAPVFRFDLESVRSAGGNLFMYASNHLLADGIKSARATIAASSP